MIVGFRTREAAEVFEGKPSKRFAATMRQIQRKLRMLDGAVVLADLRLPPGNRLEALAGNRRGQHSIRINQQWRICFVWTEKGPDYVEIVDYH